MSNSTLSNSIIGNATATDSTGAAGSAGHNDSQILIDTFQFYGNGLVLVFFALCLGRRFFPGVYNLRKTELGSEEQTNEKDPWSQSSSNDQNNGDHDPTTSTATTPNTNSDNPTTDQPSTQEQEQQEEQQEEDKDRWFHKHTPITERLRSKGLANDPRGFISWFWKLFQVSDDDFVDDCGLDALCFVRVCAMGWKLCGMGMINSIWLMPSYATADGLPDSQQSIYDRIVEITTSNVPPGSLRLTATVVASYLVFGHAMYTILQEFEWFTKQRHLFLQKRLARNYAVYIRNIPEGYQSNQALTQFFQRSMTGIQVRDAHVSMKTVKLRGQVAKRDNVILKLEHVVAEYDETKIRPTHRLEKSLQLGMGVNIGLVIPGINMTILPDALDKFDVLGIIGGKEVDSISYYAQELQRLNQDIASRIDILKLKAESSPEDVVYESNTNQDGEQEQQLPELYHDEHDQLSHYHGCDQDEENAPLMDDAEESSQPQLSMDDDDDDDEHEINNHDDENFYDPEKAPLVEDLQPQTDPQNETGTTEFENSESTTSSSNSLAKQKRMRSLHDLRTSRHDLMNRFKSNRVVQKPLELTSGAMSKIKSNRAVQMQLELTSGLVNQTSKVALKGAKVATKGAKAATKGATFVTGGATQMVTSGATSGVTAVVRGTANLVNMVLAEDGEISSAGFVVFENLSTTNAALQMVLHESPYKMEVLEAPDPDDILWLNVGREHRDLQVGRQTSLGLTIGLCLFWTIPVSFISSLSKVENLRKEVDVIDNAMNAQPWLVPLFQVLAPQLLVLLNASLPLIMEFVAMFEGHISGALVQASVFFKLVPINIIQTFFMTTLTGGVLGKLSEFVSNPQSLLDLLGQSLPTQSTFFIQFCFIATFSTFLVEGLRLGPIVSGLLRKFIGPNLTARERKKVIIGLRPFSEPFDFRTGYYWGQLVLLFMIYFVYSVIAPLVSFVAGFCFMVLASLFRHHFVYVYSPVRDSGGRVWMNFVQVITILMLIAEITIASLLSLKKAVVAVPWIIPLIVVTILFYFYIRERHFVVSNHLPMMLCLEQDQKNHHSNHAFAKDKYLQPELRKRKDLPVLSPRRLREVKILMERQLRTSQTHDEAMLEAGLMGAGKNSQELQEELVNLLKNESGEYGQASETSKGDIDDILSTQESHNGFVFVRSRSAVVPNNIEEEDEEFETENIGHAVESEREKDQHHFDAKLVDEAERNKAESESKPGEDKSECADGNASVAELYFTTPMALLEKVMVSLANETNEEPDKENQL